MKIYNLTQHALTEDQKKDGLCELPSNISAEVGKLLNFETLPSKGEVQRRAAQLGELICGIGARAVMLGGAPFLMAALTAVMKKRGVRTYFAFSPRRSIEVHTDENTVEKRSIFRYEGLIEV